MKFPCTRCGACCRRAFLVPGFPLPIRPDGACSKLVGNLCSIYDERPEMCRHGHSLDKMGMTRDEYDRLTAAICNRWQEADGMPVSFRVKLD